MFVFSINDKLTIVEAIFDVYYVIYVILDVNYLVVHVYIYTHVYCI